jgi:hypothetical protein
MFENLLRKPTTHHFKIFVHLVLESSHDELSTHMFRFPVAIHKKSAASLKKATKIRPKNAIM